SGMGSRQWTRAPTASASSRSVHAVTVQMLFVSKLPTLGRASRRQSALSSRSSLPSRAGWAWASPSADRSSNRTGVGCGRPTTGRLGRPSLSRFHWLSSWALLQAGLAHNPVGLEGFEFHRQLTTSLEHLAIVGGFILAIVGGAGPISIDRLIEKR